MFAEHVQVPLATLHTRCQSPQGQVRVTAQGYPGCCLDLLSQWKGSCHTLTCGNSERS